MSALTIALCLGNLAFCAWRTLRVLRAERVIALIWILITYHSAFLVQLAISGPFSKYRGFTNDIIQVTAESILTLAWFAFMFNVLFAAAEALVWRIAAPRPTSAAAWKLDSEPKWLQRAQLIYLGFLLVGGVLYWFKMAGGGYRDYVEFTQSNWPQVFFWASAPLITILALRGRRALAIAACVPFLFFAVYLKIRAFALLSIIPAVVVIYFQSIGGRRARRDAFLRPLVVGAVMFGFLVAVSVVVTYKKMADIEGFADTPGEITGLPDSGMIYGSAIVFEYVRDTKVSLGPDALVQYGWNIINPFMRLFRIEPPVITDPAIYMAGIVDGVPKGSAVFFHYPTLWYGDALLSFGISGLLLAVLWGAIVSLWEWLMSRNTMLLALLLPYYTWHAYMLVRGTPTGATVPLAYAGYLSLLALIIAAQFRFLRRPRSASGSRFL